MIKETKRTLFRIFFIVEIVLFSLFYIFGSYGLQALYRIERENDSLTLQIQELKKATKQLEREINAWQTESFYKEKKAREQLQMARAGDRIYYLE